MTRISNLIDSLTQKLRFRRVRPTPLPQKRFLHTRLDTDLKCNLRCKMCFIPECLHGIAHKPFTIDHFRRIMDQLAPYTKQLALSCIAEPLLSPTFFEALKELDKSDIPFIYFITNGTLLTEEAIKKILDSRIDMMCVSLEGATQDTLGGIRLGANLDQITNNLRMFIRMRNERGKTRPLLNISTVLMRSNIEEAPKIVKLAAELHADALLLRHLLSRSGRPEEESLWYHKELANRCLEEARRVTKEMNIPEVSIPPNFDLQTKPPSKAARCGEVKNEVEITLSGEVLPCGGITMESLGNLYRQTLREIWNGPEWRKLRDTSTKNVPFQSCRLCPCVANNDVDDPRTFFDSNEMGVGMLETALPELNSGNPARIRRKVEELVDCYSKYVELADQYIPRSAADMDKAALKWRDYCVRSLAQVARNKPRNA